MKKGDFVNVHLVEPVERHWGKLLRLDQTGVTLRGISVKQLETFKYQWKREDRLVFPQTIFFPMRRVQQVDLDEPVGHVPSVIEDIKRVTGLDEDTLLG